jgi:hypothetical protein
MAAEPRIGHTQIKPRAFFPCGWDSRLAGRASLLRPAFHLQAHSLGFACFHENIKTCGQ